MKKRQVQADFEVERTSLQEGGIQLAKNLAKNLIADSGITAEEAGQALRKLHIKKENK